MNDEERNQWYSNERKQGMISLVSWLALWLVIIFIACAIIANGDDITCAFDGLFRGVDHSCTQ